MKVNLINITNTSTYKDVLPGQYFGVYHNDKYIYCQCLIGGVVVDLTNGKIYDSNFISDNTTVDILTRLGTNPEIVYMQYGELESGDVFMYNQKLYMKISELSTKAAYHIKGCSMVDFYIGHDEEVMYIPNFSIDLCSKNIRTGDDK